MDGSSYKISIEHDYVLVQRPQHYAVVLDEQPALLAELSAVCEQAGTRNVLILGPKTEVGLSTFDIFELGGQIANSRLRIAIAEEHDAANEDVEFLESVAWNRGGLIKFFDSKKEAEDWLGTS